MYMLDAMKKDILFYSLSIRLIKKCGERMEKNEDKKMGRGKGQSHRTLN